ncbi:MAG: 6-carboxytetrahydropterin synthase [Verrucomicrobiae bacterium]|nr:6-carboxytetrahydropterin synthase [Verrucomicrobiae bacterium]MCP5538916.1 6-carboxytetrahydropterin synthase [Akkermansiaceae bacterium]
MGAETHDFVLRFTRRYSMAHRLTSGVAPNCAVPHGHDEVVTVDIASRENAGLRPETNMLVEFEQVKRRWFQWIDKAVDHSFHLAEGDRLIGFFRENEPRLLARILVTPGDPTTEIKAACYHAKLTAFLDAENPAFLCRRLAIQETPTNAVEFNGATTEGILPGGDRWWNRADLSINDLAAA